jgi:hypothetical protein
MSVVALPPRRVPSDVVFCTWVFCYGRLRSSIAETEMKSRALYNSLYSTGGFPIKTGVLVQRRLQWWSLERFVPSRLR